MSSKSQHRRHRSRGRLSRRLEARLQPVEGPAPRGWVRDCDLPDAPELAPDALDRWPFDVSVPHFLSGCNHEGEIKAVTLSGHDVGVCVSEMGEAAFRELELVLECGQSRVFVDSGAFGEVAWSVELARLVVKKRITDVEWQKRLRLYARLAAAAWVPSKLYVVAPDCVAHQGATLKRLFRYRDAVRRLVDRGVRVIVPVQKGADLTMCQFRDRAAQILDRGALVWGIPMKKDATTLEELESFLLGFLPFEPVRLHLLGLGARSDRYAEAIALIRQYRPDAEITCDSVRIMAMVGKSNGPGGGPRKLTAARTAVLAELGQGAPTAEVKFRALQRVLMAENADEVAQARAQGWRDDGEEEEPEESDAVGTPGSAAGDGREAAGEPPAAPARAGAWRAAG